MTIFESVREIVLLLEENGRERMIFISLIVIAITLLVTGSIFFAKLKNRK